MNFFELFAGKRCMGVEAEKQGFDVYSVDWGNFPNLFLKMDIMDLRPEHFPCVPDHVHMSFDCTSYTISAISHHRNGIEPTSDYAKFCDTVNQHSIALVKYWKTLNPYLTYSIENPRGMLRKMPWMQEFIRHTVWYCQYGDDRAKPTDIWTDVLWVPRPVCHNGNKNCHHQPAPRGSKTGTQGRKGSVERSLIPSELCRELIEARTLMCEI